MKLEIGGGAAEIARDEWDALAAASGPDNPFVEHAFLALLETSGSVGEGTGWVPRFLLVRDRGALVGAAPAYVKDDSYGEYIFDWGWADAAMRAGIAYYPKVVSAVPFTPATGPRLLVRDPAALPLLVEGLVKLERAERASGTHVLFCTDQEAAALAEAGWVRRATHQFHFRNPGYASFDDFLAQLRAEPRKQIRKERRRVAEAGLEIAVLGGREVDRATWRELHRFYVSTIDRKWGRPYLAEAFFDRAGDELGARAVVAVARRHGALIAAALAFEKGSSLFGRYWGCKEEVDGLHFELCYYRLIERAIARGQRLVEAGAQGEHKVKRGFVPVVTHSAHRLAHPGLHAAVARAVASERDAVEQGVLHAHTPFREGAAPPYPPRAGIALTSRASSGSPW